MSETKRRSREHIHLPRHLGDKLADAFATGIGSWRFVIIQAVLMVLWVLVNTLALFQVLRFDSYPFVFMNLAMSAEAAFSAPIIMMSQNRASARDRTRDDLESQEISSIFSSHDLLLQINQQQLTLLQQQSDILNLLREQQEAR